MKKKYGIKRFLSLRSRYISSIVVIVLLALTFTYLQLRYMDDIFIFAKKQVMISATQTILNMDFENGDIERSMSELESTNSIYVEVYLQRENLIYTSGTNDYVFDANRKRSEDMKPRIMEIVSHDDVDDNSYFEERREHFTTSRYIVYEKTNEDITAVVFASLDTIYENVLTANVAMIILSVIFLLAMLAFVSFYNWRIIIPIEKINSNTKRIAALDFPPQLSSFKIKDLNELGESINHLSVSLSNNIKSLKESNDKLERDIRKKEQMDENRRQFIANASHELKTPIAIIQSYAEGVKYDDTHESTDEYCDIILDETEKMTKLILRLMEMVKYDSEVYVPKFSAFEIDSWIEEFMKPFERHAQNENINIVLDLNSNSFGYGNADMLSQILSNYVANAFSHCENERKIVVQSVSEQSEVIVSVFNTGKHIAQEDLPNIWESFYRADKAHSRAEGRFGLGLSIVRSVQKMHRQNYGVENVEGGVKFWFSIGKFENGPEIS